jgi:hypothetical protein
MAGSADVALISSLERRRPQRVEKVSFSKEFKNAALSHGHAGRAAARKPEQGCQGSAEVFAGAVGVKSFPL